MNVRPIRAFAIALLLVPLAFAGTPTQAAAELPQTPLCGGVPGVPNPNAGCQLPLAKGVNLAVWLQYWIPSSYTTSEDLAQIKSMGFTFVRLPVNPELLLVGTAGSRTIDAGKLTMIMNAVDLVVEADLGVVVDLHPYEQYTQRVLTNEQYREEYTNFLEAFARELAKRPMNRVALGLLNEPADPDYNPHTPFDYNPIQEELWFAARLGAPLLTLIATGDDWSSVEGLARVKPLPDHNVIYEFHFYSPFLFTHQGAHWTWHVVKPLFDVPYPSTPAKVDAVRGNILATITDPNVRRDVDQHLTWYGDERWNRARLADQIAGAASWARNNNVRLMLGEFGVYEGKAPDADRVAWTRDVRQIAESRNIPWAYWNWDSDFGVVDRETGVVHEGLRSALLG